MFQVNNELNNNRSRITSPLGIHAAPVFRLHYRTKKPFIKPVYIIMKNELQERILIILKTNTFTGAQIGSRNKRQGSTAQMKCVSFYA